MLDWRKALVAATAALSIGAVQAAYIVNTGEPTGGSDPLSLARVVTTQLDSFQHLGVTFNVAQSSTITSVEGWIGNDLPSSLEGDVRFELREGADPNAGATLFSSTVTIPFGVATWRGAIGLVGWSVTAGDYTLTAIAQPGFHAGYMPLNPPPATVAGTEWISSTVQPTWTATTFNMGWRIGADPAVVTVPEPGSLALIALGLAFLGGSAARRRRA